MTVTVIEQATKSFRCTCSKCRCRFSYELVDIRQNYVRGGEGVFCPGCSEYIRHDGGGRWMAGGSES